MYLESANRLEHPGNSECDDGGPESNSGRALTIIPLKVGLCSLRDRDK